MNPSEIYSFFFGVILQGEVSEILKAKEPRVVIGGQNQLKYAMSILLNILCDKEIITLPDDESISASVAGMIRILEYEPEA